jgi:AraC-like DNA-binding protein
MSLGPLMLTAPSVMESVMQWIHSASSFLAVSQLLFLASLFLVYFPQRRLARLIAVFSICLIAYIIARQPDLALGPLRSFLYLLAVMAPALLWVIARYLFEDNPRIHTLIWVLIVSYIALRGVGLFVYDSTQSLSGVLYLIYFYLPQLIMLALACHVVYLACHGRNEDLVELRRQLRVPFAIGMGVVVGLIIGSGFFVTSSMQLDSLYFFVIFLLILFVNLGMFQIHKETLVLIHTAADKEQPLARPVSGALPIPTITQDTAPAERISSQDQAMIDRVLTAMQTQRLYAESGLTIGDLAEKVSMQEYRLRRLINQTLHFRNFNQFLNRYRIEEAGRRLLDPAEEHLPISSIALDVGYASLSSFNKAFKETHGLTPSAWRAGQNLAQPRTEANKLTYQG